MTATEMQQEALGRAVGNLSVSNYPAIYEGFREMGFVDADIRPRENIFTFNAWKAKGRIVKKGQHGVKIVSYVVMSKKDKATGEKSTFRRPRAVSVFHESQTQEV